MIIFINSQLSLPLSFSLSDINYLDAAGHNAGRHGNQLVDLEKQGG